MLESSSSRALGVKGTDGRAEPQRAEHFQVGRTAADVLTRHLNNFNSDTSIKKGQRAWLVTRDLTAFFFLPPRHLSVMFMNSHVTTRLFGLLGVL